MHLLSATPGGFSDQEGIIDLDQTPGDIVILTASDSSLGLLVQGADNLDDKYPSIRIANWSYLAKPAAFDLYQHKVLEQAKLIIVSMLGGAGYWQYGFERLTEMAITNQHNYVQSILFVPGDDSEDHELLKASNVPVVHLTRIWRYLREGGVANITNLYHYIGATFFSLNLSWSEPKCLAKCIFYAPGKSKSENLGVDSLIEWQNRRGNQVGEQRSKPVCLLLFYRSHLQSANTRMFDELIAVIEEKSIEVLPIALVSLKDRESLTIINSLIEQCNIRLIINTTAFACNTVSQHELSNNTETISWLFHPSVVVLQLILSSTTQQDWEGHFQGLRSRDLAMQVVLPEIDGRVITYPVSFKHQSMFNPRCQTNVTRYTIHRERSEFVAELVRYYSALASKNNAEKRVALVLANYPTKDGRIGNGVGLDTPESCMGILSALQAAGYNCGQLPENGSQLIDRLLQSVTNDITTIDIKPCQQSMSVSEYERHFSTIPMENQQAVILRWGALHNDPKFRNGRIMLSGFHLGNLFIGIQPARGFERDLVANYHDPDLVPPHSYLAFYFWLRHIYKIDAVIHVGKHGNLEWLPGKSVALSEQCWPNIALGPIPNFYPFIVNDPGEGAQAKRRTHAVIIDHLMPPLTRSELYGGLTDLENLVDEYYQALGLDAQRENWLKKEILKKAEESNLIEELQLQKSDAESDEQAEQEVLVNLDAYLCEIKESQIRNGLHILGLLPDTPQLLDTMVALLRMSNAVSDRTHGLLHAICEDLNLRQNNMPFDPLVFNSTEVWNGDKPKVLQTVSSRPWRTCSDTRERLEILAKELLNNHLFSDPENFDKQKLQKTGKLLNHTSTRVLALLKRSVALEIESVVRGLDAEFIEPGPSGAPSRGRLDTLPTGRNFYSVDGRSIPTPAAWALGKKSAQKLVERHLQEKGDYPKQMGLSIWGTATMRTGGDDIAQAMALMGVKPIWSKASNRVVDFEIIPSMILGRPRVDVTLRVSGFFRDAFPNVMSWFDAAVQALANYEEPGGSNTIYTNVQKRMNILLEKGLTQSEAKKQASYRVFGSKPGAYGAGLQGLIDERCWENRADLAEAYVNWSGYAYGQSHSDGIAAHSAFQYQMSTVEAVIHNQDNREHDILDSDDYYQFQGGMANAISIARGEKPVIYHADHSNPAFPIVRTLKQELNRVMRSRVLNPKWIAAMRNHGYKGAFEMAASVDYLFAYDATTNLVDDYQYRAVTDALILDDINQIFLQDNNINALQEMAERMLEAIQRGMWQDSGEYRDALQELLLGIDQQLEAMGSLSEE